MCGINVIVDKKNQLDSGPIVNMNKATRHRGPDHQGFRKFEMGGYALFMGSNRLKILGLQEQANQPVVSRNSDRCMVYNGEVYNHMDLKKELLSAGYHFETNSDTEVLFYALNEWGIDVLSRLNGMYALAYYDAKQGELHMARDPVGMKPIYYYEDDNYLVSSSEIKGLLSSGLVPKILNESAINNYLQWGYAPKPQTFYQDIHELLPNHKLHFAEGRSKVLPGFLKHQETPEPGSDGLLVEKAKELLNEAVLRHIVCDVPYGLFLSGGVDSTLLLALLTQAGADKVPTFSIAYRQNEGSFGTHDDRYALMASRTLGSQHTELQIDLKVLNRFEEFLDQVDQPVGDSGAFLTYLLSEKARESVKVILSGAGADELFGGYNRHRAYLNYLKNHSLYRLLHKPLKYVGSCLPTGFDHPLRANFRLIKKFVGGLDADPVRTYSNFCSLSELTSLELEGFRVDQNDRFEERFLNGALNHDRNFYLVSDVLAISDSSSMAHSLEMRMPYLDREVYSYFGGLSSLHLLKNGPKWILKDLLKVFMPSSFVERSKEGFGLPLGAWLHKKETHHLFGFVEKPGSIISNFVPDPVIRMFWQEHQSKKEDHSRILWSLMVLNSWLEKNFG